MQARSRQTPIEFSGPPANLSARVALPAPLVQPRIKIGNDELPLRVSGDVDTIHSLAFSMPDDTPPCELKGRVILGDTVHPALVTVRQRPKMRIEPSRIDLKAPAGQSVETTLNVTNLGNLALEFAADKSVTLREAGMLGRSVASAFRKRDRDFADRLIALGENIRRTPSHELSVAGRMSPATLEVGSHTTVSLTLGIPKEIDVDTRWSGSLALLGTRVRINVEPTTPRE